MTNKKYLTIFTSKVKPVISRDHTVCCGTLEILQPNLLKDHYHSMSFSFDFLKRAESFFKAIHGDLFDEERLRCMMPNKLEAPVIFVYEVSDDEAQLFAIAPRLDDKFAKQNSRSVSEK